MRRGRGRSDPRVGTATYDYRLGALGGAARGTGRQLETVLLKPEAPGRSAHCSQPVVVCCR